MSQKQHKKQLTKKKSIKHRIYGIFDFNLNKIVYVNIDFEQTELEFEIGDYDPNQYDIVFFDVVLI